MALICSPIWKFGADWIAMASHHDDMLTLQLRASFSLVTIQKIMHKMESQGVKSVHKCPESVSTSTTLAWIW